MKKFRHSSIVALKETGKRILVFLLIISWVFSGYPASFFENLALAPAETHAAVGDFAVYREASGGEAVGLSYIDNGWDTTVSEGAGFTLGGGSSELVDLTDGGHYLAMYNLAVDTNTGSNRSEVQSLIDVNGTSLAYGRSSCMIRRSGGLDECWMAGAAIIDATAGHDLKIRSWRTDSNSATVKRRANESGLTLVKLDDNWDYARVREAGGGQYFSSATFSTVSWDTNDELDSGTFSRTNGDITLAEAGKYLVTSNMMFRSGTTARRNQETRLTLDGFELAGTRVTAHLPGVNSVQDHAATFVGIIEATTTSQVLRLEGRCESESCGSVTNVGGQTAITIVKLPNAVEYVRLGEAGGGQAVDGSNDPITWDTGIEVEPAYSHSTGATSSRITIEENDDYLFLGSFYSNRSAYTSLSLLYPHWEWRKGGSSIGQYGSFGKINYGDDSVFGSFSAGNSGGFIGVGYTAGDYIELINSDEGTGADATATFIANRMAVQGIRISTLVQPDVSVSAVGTQTGTVYASSSSEYVGASFALIDNTGSHTISGITITENGTVDAQNNLDNIKLYYETDTSAPYNCVSEAYAGTEAQFGSTDTDGFSAANGTSAFVGAQVISSTVSMCVYVVMDITNNASDGDTIDIEITDPSTDVSVVSGSSEPSTIVALAGSTTINNDDLTQIHYHWRNNDGSEAAATAAASEDTYIPALQKATTTRLRIEVSNEGTATSSATQYRLEYGTKLTTCDVIGSWTDVGAVGGDWDMSNSTYLTDGNDTTNIAIGIGGTTDENTTFETPNAAVKDTSSQTADITLATDEFVEIEYSIEALAGAADGTTYCFRTTDAGTALPTYGVYPEVVLKSDVSIGTNGIQVAELNVGSTSAYMGGQFAIIENSGPRNVTSITITEKGTVDAETNLDNIELYYEIDNTAPYDCVSETYEGGEAQFGSTDTDGFSDINGTSTFVGSQAISLTAAMCVYTVLDVGAGASPSETIDIEISNPSNDVVVSGGGTVSPSSQVLLSGSTLIVDDDLTQAHYHWRNDDGSEVGASSMSTTEDTPVINIPKGETIRVRMEVSNEGTATSSASKYRLEFGEKITSCSAIGTWADVGVVGGEWDMSDSANLTDGANTTNIAVSTGGVTDENTTFLTPNGGVRDTSSQTGNLTLAKTEFVELEYAIHAGDAANYNTTYCFRLTDGGTELDTYSVYAEARIRQNKDFEIQRGSETITGTEYTIYAGTDYVAPNASTTAFIRITNTNHTGAGRAPGGGYQNSDDVTAYITNPSNILNSITFKRYGSANDTYLSWEIVEYVGPSGGDNEIIVHDQRAVTFGSTSLYATTSVSGVTTDADMVVFVTGQANPDTGRADYNTGIVTSDWVGSSDDAVLTRGEAGSDAISVSQAAIEFIGSNWKIQRSEHTYTSSPGAQTENITAVNNLGRTFLHVQKRVNGLPGVDEFGHTVWLSSTNQVSYQITNTAGTPSNQTGVAWVIENTQTDGTPMVVTRSNGTQSGGAEPSTVNVPIGKTLDDITVSSIFSNSRTTGSDDSFPRPIMAAQIISTTTYQFWVSDTGQTRYYNTEIVEWPTSIRTIKQNYYRFYVDNDLLDPTDPWPLGVSDLGENTSITADDEPLLDGEVVRIRMSLAIAGSSLPASAKQFKLQYGLRSTTCGAIVTWSDLGDVGSTTALWRGYNGAVVDGVALSGNPPTAGDLNLSVSDRSGTYEEQNPTPLNPYTVSKGEDLEFDWVVQQNSAVEQSTYCMRMTYSDDTALDEYTFYPTLTTAGYDITLTNWRWYDDPENETPIDPLAFEKIAPNNVVKGDDIKLRTTIEELAGKDGPNAKFKLQFSTQSDFSSDVHDVDEIWSCSGPSLWCYADGGGVDNATTTSIVLSDADSCVAGVGAGCGTHNESGTSTSVYTHQGSGATEFEFTITNYSAIDNTTYFFRAYDVTNAEAVVASTTNPSVVTSGGTLTFGITGLPAGTTTEGIITDATTTPVSVPYGTLESGTPLEAAQRLSVSTSALGGYQVLAYERQGFLGTTGSEIPGVTGTNAAPTTWAVGCLGSATGCYGYHAGDNGLSGGSTRFQANDTFADMTSTAEEVAYNSGPVIDEETDMVYKVGITGMQAAGQYETTVVHIVVPIY